MDMEKMGFTIKVRSAKFLLLFILKVNHMWVLYRKAKNEGTIGTTPVTVHPAGLWFPSSRVQTLQKPSDFSDVKILSMPSFGGEVK
jgi:hypothetical protein